ncbi:conserved Plasmodium protein, unknown function [Plasmodium knowlesi strain H]|uniref:HTH OST-type domain-containing protein n=1 Tax=Plasmodium knowlesi (strain H) TaxID=5851 RepID=A0A193QZM4_PLAKH|nr:conserved Plasmodium protein, unknown function [Plasmodium knowlesi strain H]
MQENVRTKINDAKSCLMGFLGSTKVASILQEESDKKNLDKSKEDVESADVCSLSENPGEKVQEDSLLANQDSDVLKKRKTGTILSRRSDNCDTSTGESKEEDSVAKSTGGNEDAGDEVCLTDAKEKEDLGKECSTSEKKIKRNNLSDVQYIESLKCEIDETRDGQPIPQYESKLNPVAPEFKPQNSLYVYQQMQQHTTKNLVMLIKSFGYQGIKMEKISGEYCKKYNALLNLRHAGFSNIYNMIRSLDHCLICEEVGGEADKLTDKLTDKSTEKSTDKSTDKLTDKLTDKSTDKLTDKLTDKSTDKLTDKLTDKSTDKLTDKPTDKSMEKCEEPHDKDPTPNEPKQANHDSEKNLIIKYKTPKMNEDKQFFLKIILGTIGECTNYNSQLTEEETPESGSVSLTRLQQEVKKIFGSSFNLKILQTRCGIDKLQAFLEEIQEIQIISLPNDVKIRITPLTYSYKIPDLKSIKSLPSNEFKVSAPSKMGSKKVPISTLFNDQYFRSNSFNGGENNSILSALNSRDRGSFSNVHMGSVLTQNNDFKNKKFNSNGSFLLPTSKSHERIWKGVSSGSIHRSGSSLLHGVFVNNVPDDRDSESVLQMKGSFTQEPCTNLMCKLNRQGTHGNHDNSCIYSSDWVATEGQNYPSKQHTNGGHSLNHNLSEHASRNLSNSQEQHPFIKMLSKTQLHILLYQLIVVLTKRQKMEWDDIVKIKEELLHQNSSKTYGEENLGRCKLEVSGCEEYVNKVEVDADSAKEESNEVQPGEGKGEDQQNNSTTNMSDFVYEIFTTQETAKQSISDKTSSALYSKDPLSSSLEKGPDEEVSKNIIGVFVSSIKSEWNKAYTEQYPLSFYLNHYKAKKLRRLLEEIPNLVIAGCSRSIQVFTLDTAQYIYDNFSSEELSSLKIFSRSKFTPMSASHYFKDATYKDVAEEFARGDCSKMMKVLGLDHLKPPRSTVSKSYEKIMNKSRKSRSFNRVGSYINYRNKIFDHPNGGGSFVSNEEGTFLQGMPFVERGGEETNLEVLRYHVHKLLYNLVIHVCKKQNALYLAYKKNGVILSEYEMNKQMCGPIYYSSDLTYEDFITDRQSLFEKEQVAKTLFLLSHHGIYGIKFIHLTNEWYKLYKCELRPLMRICEYNEIGKMICSMPNVLVVGEGFDTKYIPSMDAEGERNHLDEFSPDSLVKIISNNFPENLPSVFPRRSHPAEALHKQKSGPYESIMEVLFPNITSQKSTDLHKGHSGTVPFLRNNIGGYGKGTSGFLGASGNCSSKGDINISSLFRNL